MSKKEISLQETLTVLLDDSSLHDVQLICNDGVKVGAIRSILAARSPVFRGLLFGHCKESKSGEVEIDYPSDRVRAVVEYIHSDSTELLRQANKRTSDGETTFEASQISELVAVAEAAHYFEVTGLETKLAKSFSDAVETSTCLALPLLGACMEGGPTVLECFRNECLQHIRTQKFATSLCANDMAGVTAETIESIAKDPYVNMTEYQLFNILDMWVQSSSTTSEEKSRKKASKGIIKHIHLDLIEPSLLDSAVASSELVSKQCLHEVYKKQILRAEKTRSFDFGKRRCDPVWSSSSRSNFRGGSSCRVSSLHRCPAMIPGGHFQWKIKVVSISGRIGRSDDFVSENCDPSRVFLGMHSSREIPSYTIPDHAWGVKGNGNTLSSVGVSSESALAFSEGSVVTFELDLREDSPENGRFQACVDAGGDWHTIASDLLTYLREHPANDTNLGGFIPAAKLQGRRTEIDLLSFSELRGSAYWGA